MFGVLCFLRNCVALRCIFPMNLYVCFVCISVGVAFVSERYKKRVKERMQCLCEREPCMQCL